MREAGRRDEIARGGGSKAATTVGIVLGGVSAVLFVLVALAFSRASDLEGELDDTREEFMRLSKKTESLKTDLVGIEGELRQLRAASAEVTGLRRKVAELEERKGLPADEAKIREVVTSALEERRAAMGARFARGREGGQPAEQAMERFAERVDIDKVEKNVRGLAEAFLQGARADQKDGEAGEKAKAGKLPDGADKTITEGFDLWRQLREGKITQEEFRRRSRELREKMRKEFGGLEGMFGRGRRDRPPEDTKEKEKDEGGTF